MSGKKLIESANKGFSLNLEVKYLKCLKKILSKMSKLSKAMEMGGFGLKLSSDASVKFTFDDLDELKEYEFIEKFLETNLNDLFDELGVEVSDVLGY